jgi:hypothetical protein
MFVCARCGAATGRPHPLSTQHRQARGMGGTSRTAVNLPSNLLTLCGSGTTGCHGWVEAHPAESRANGWSVPSWETPARIPVLTWRGWMQLDDAGGLELLPDYEPECAS